MRDEPEIVKELRQAEKNGGLLRSSAHASSLFDSAFSETSETRTTMHRIESLGELIPPHPQRPPRRPAGPSVPSTLKLRLHHLKDANVYLKEQLNDVRDHADELHRSHRHLRQVLTADHLILSGHLQLLSHHQKTVEMLLLDQLASVTDSDAHPSLLFHQIMQQLLTDQLRFYFSLRKGASTCSQQQVDLAECLTKILEPYQLLLDHLQVTCTVNVSRQPPKLCIDFTHLRHIILHFLFTLLSIHQTPVDISFTVTHRKTDVLLHLALHNNTFTSETTPEKRVEQNLSWITPVVQGLLFANGGSFSHHQSLGKITDSTITLPLEPESDVEGRFNRFFADQTMRPKKQSNQQA